MKQKAVFLIFCILILVVGCSSVDNSKKNDNVKTQISNNIESEYIIKYPLNFSQEEKNDRKELQNVMNKQVTNLPNDKITLTGVATTFVNKEHGFAFLLVNKSQKIAYNVVYDVTVTKKDDNNVMFDKFQVDFPEQEYGRLNPKEAFIKSIPFPKEKQTYSDYGDGSDYDLYVEIISSEVEE